MRVFVLQQIYYILLHLDLIFSGARGQYKHNFSVIPNTSTSLSVWSTLFNISDSIKDLRISTSVSVHRTEATAHDQKLTYHRRDAITSSLRTHGSSLIRLKSLPITIIILITIKVGGAAKYDKKKNRKSLAAPPRVPAYVRKELQKLSAEK